MKKLVKQILRRFNVIPQDSLEQRINAMFVKRSAGVLHIGAHYGQEAQFYADNSAAVVWIEANPVIYEKLKLEISRFPEQIAIQALLGNENLDEITFHIASNDAMSSSIYEFGSELGFADLSMSSVLSLPMVRLDSILSESFLTKYSHWVLDVQGAELSVLEGAGKLLDSCNSINLEVSTREVYKGGTTYDELTDFLKERNLVPLWEPAAHSHENVMFIRA